MSDNKQLIYWFKDLGIKDVPVVGGKNASLGEMYANLTSKGVRVPNGFAVSAYAYNYFVNSTGLRPKIEALLTGLDTRNMDQLAKRGEEIRSLIRKEAMPADLEQAIKDSYDELCKFYHAEVDTAIRSSATAEDLPDASFAGQQDTYLNIHGHDSLLTACRNCFASLFTDRAISYRQEKNFDHFQVALSIAVQKMVRSDLSAAGVMFSIDTESGFKDVAYITAGYGLGENVVQGSINPDEWYVHKPTLAKGFKSIIHAAVGAKQQKMVYAASGKGTENVPVAQEDRDRFSITPEDVLTLAKWAQQIEDHYSAEAGHYKPMDMEWAKDGQSGELFIVQARPETVHSRRERGVINRVVLGKTSKVLAEGMAVGDSVGTGKAHVIKSAKDISTFTPGSVLVTEMTDPDWVPIMKVASAIVTDMGGRTCHAAIISRELGIPCIVGTGSGSKNIPNGQDITVSCSGGSKGLVYDGVLPFEVKSLKLADLEMPKMSFWFQQNAPDRAFPDAQYPVKGVGLVRMDELIRDEVKAHPLACKNFAQWKKSGQESQAVTQIEAASLGFPDKVEYFVEKLAQSIAHIACSVYPNPVRVLLPDAPSNDLDRLAGGKPFSFDETNPLLGARGAARFSDLDYEEALELELKALSRAINDKGMDNISIVLPAALTKREINDLLSPLNSNGLKRSGKLQHHLLCRTPAQLSSLEELAGQFDGFLVDVAEVAQLTLGMDARNVRVKGYYKEAHPAVISLLDGAIQSAKKAGKQIALANIAPANLKDFASHPAILAADALVIRPDLFDAAREALLEVK